MNQYVTACAAAARSRWLWLVVLVVFTFVVGLPNARGDITPEGDVFPADPSMWDNSTDGRIGNTSSGTLTIDGGSHVSCNPGYIGYSSTGAGVVNVTGTGSMWTNTCYLYVGNSGSGMLSIASGGTVSVGGILGYSYVGNNAGSTGAILVDGAGSTLINSGYLYIGTGGSGTLSITEGGSVQVCGSYPVSYIGTNSGSTGIVTVDGNGSTWTTGQLIVSGDGTGRLSITNHGNVRSGGGNISGVATVDGLGSTWTDSSVTGLCVNGTVSISNSGSATCEYCCIGDSPGANGIVTVDGSGSMWSVGNTTSTSTNKLFVGYRSNGTLSIANGANVTVPGNTLVALSSVITGLIDFGEHGGTLTTRTILASPTQLSGTGTVNACGLISDIDLKFDSKHGPKQSIMFRQPGQDIVVNLDMTTNPSGNGELGAGWRGAGSLTIQDGVQVTSLYGYLGYGTGTSGVATVAGTGSKWTTRGSLGVGFRGEGVLSVTDGAVVNSGNADIGDNSTARGVVWVDGSGSAFAGMAPLVVGRNGAGTLSVTHGGSVTSGIAFGGLTNYLGSNPDSEGVVTIDGIGSSWSCTGDLFVGNSGSGTLSITHGGSVNNSSSGSYGFGSFIGYSPGSAGLVVVNGIGSTLAIQRDSRSNTSFYIGYGGSGTLLVTDGGSASVAGTTYVGYGTGATGLIDFGVGAGTFTTKTLFVAALQLSGTGTINTCGFVGDADVVLDLAHGSRQAITIQQPGRNVRINIDLTSTPDAFGCGWNDAGSLAIKDGFKLNSLNGYVGYKAGSAGTASVIGTGSTWAISGTQSSNSSFLIGNSGSGTLLVAAGGSVSSGRKAVDSSVGHNAGAIGVVSVDGGGSIWNSQGALFVGNSGSGTLSITNGGTVSNTSAHIGNSPGSAGTVDVGDVGSTWNNNGAVFVGDSGSGTLSISHGGRVITTSGGAVGYGPGSVGVVAIDGTGSAWTNTGSGASLFWIGNSGGGTLSLTNGGSLNSGQAPVFVRGYGASSRLVVDGPGSAWTGNGSVNISDSGSVVAKNGGRFGGGNLILSSCDATLTIIGGGSVTANSTSLYNALLTIDIGRGSSLNLGTGWVGTDNCMIRTLAGAGVPADGAAYSPIIAGTWTAWNGGGAYQAIGGTWSSTARTFTASRVVGGTAGVPVSFDRSLAQRVLVAGSATGGTQWAVGASFPAAGTASNMTFTATVMDDSILDTLRSGLPTTKSVLSGWTFAATDFTVDSNNPVYLSYQVGGGHPSSRLEVWHYSGSQWAQYSAYDLTCDGNYASFTATGFSGYAMVAVPEPGTLALLAVGLMGVMAYARRKRK